MCEASGYLLVFGLFGFGSRGEVLLFHSDEALIWLKKSNSCRIRPTLGAKADRVPEVGVLSSSNVSLAAHAGSRCWCYFGK